MKIRIKDNFFAEIFLDNEFNEGSTDNLNSYHRVYIENLGYRQNQIAIKLFQNNLVVNSCIIGAGLGTVHPNSLIAKADKILICVGENILSLSIHDLKKNWSTKTDEVCCISIHPYKDDYIIHGEMYISRLDARGNIIWQLSGRDIFINIKSEGNFILTEDFISVTDFENNLYKFDYDGNIIHN